MLGRRGRARTDCAWKRSHVAISACIHSEEREAASEVLRPPSHKHSPTDCTPAACLAGTLHPQRPPRYLLLLGKTLLPPPHLTISLHCLTDKPAARRAIARRNRSKRANRPVRGPRFQTTPCEAPVDGEREREAVAGVSVSVCCFLVFIGGALGPSAI